MQTIFSQEKTVKIFSVPDRVRSQLQNPDMSSFSDSAFFDSDK